jgi:hypothetical protein
MPASEVILDARSGDLSQPAAKGASTGIVVEPVNRAHHRVHDVLGHVGRVRILQSGVASGAEYER